MLLSWILNCFHSNFYSPLSARCILYRLEQFCLLFFPLLPCIRQITQGSWLHYKVFCFKPMNTSIGHSQFGSILMLVLPTFLDWKWVIAPWTQSDTNGQILASMRHSPSWEFIPQKPFCVVFPALKRPMNSVPSIGDDSLGLYQALLYYWPRKMKSAEFCQLFLDSRVAICMLNYATVASISGLLCWTNQFHDVNLSFRTKHCFRSVFFSKPIQRASMYTTFSGFDPTRLLLTVS